MTARSHRRHTASPSLADLLFMHTDTPRSTTALTDATPDGNAHRITLADGRARPWRPSEPLHPN